MNPTEIEFAVRDLVAKPHDPATFPFDLIGIFNTSKVTVSRLKSGQTNAAKQPGDVLWRKHLFFRAVDPGDDVGAIGDALAADPLTAKHKPRFILVTNGEQVHVRDLRFGDTENVEYARLDEKSDFLLPLAGYERRAVVQEHPADVKAAKKLKKLYDALLAANPTWSTGHHTHELNLLITRLLFCFYAEKTGIFDTSKVFTNTITQHTSEDGTDVAPLLDRFFRIMNIEDERRPKSTPSADATFPYVNGSLFEDTVEIPQFSRTARRQLLECGDLDWRTINPDIFGSMIQTVAQDGTRSDLGMHYTSVPNIMKVLQPLFLDDLHEAYEKAKDNAPKLEALLGRLSKIRVFDPACGSGNFLIIAYREMRKLEINILQRIGEIAAEAPLRLSGISLQHFFGIDVVDFACETAKLSLWLAEHQMNSSFNQVFGTATPTLPLAKICTIKNGNALRMDWQSVCPPHDDLEIYICGNPPFKGFTWQTPEQRSDIAHVFSNHTTHYRELDIVSAWFLKAAEYIRCHIGHVSSALVATNSICQGEIVPMLWPLVLRDGVVIKFAYTSFKWANNASNNAGVTCIIVGLSGNGKGKKRIFSRDHVEDVGNISPYLIPTSRYLIVEKALRPLSDLPVMIWGNKPTDGGHLILSAGERDDIVKNFPEAQPLIRPLIGSDEFVNGGQRFCLWIADEQLLLAMSIPPINNRISAVKRFRLDSKAQSTRDYSRLSHRFRQIQDWGKEAILVPRVTSERRQYLQIGTVPADVIINDRAFAIYSPPAYLLSVLSSRMHWLWLNTVGGKLEERLSYSSTLVYNTFPLPDLSAEQEGALSDYSRSIIRARAKHPGKTIAWLYNPETMPDNLLAIHRENDTFIEEHVYGRRFSDDNRRLEHLFAMYERREMAHSDGLRLKLGGAS
jgi:hypothetical protein